MLRRNIILFVFTLLIASCEDIIQIDLRSVEPKIVIEGTISNQDVLPMVKITKSTDYYDPGIYEQVSGASVIMRDDLGFSETLREAEPGVYVADSIAAREGSDYFLEVRVEGEVYSARSRMEYIVPIDSLKVEYIPGRGFFNEGFYIHCFFHDPAEDENFYRVIAYKNGQMEQALNLTDDIFINGRTVDFFLFFPVYQVGDTATIDLLSLDPAVYDYYLTLQNVVSMHGGGNPANPSNPNSNISNGALGYFGALATHREYLVIGE